MHFQAPHKWACTSEVGVHLRSGRAPHIVGISQAGTQVEPPMLLYHVLTRAQQRIGNIYLNASLFIEGIKYNLPIRTETLYVVLNYSYENK